MLLPPLLALLISVTYNAAAPCQRVVCYYTNWPQYRPEPYNFFPEDIPKYKCTHIMFAFAKIVNGQLAPFEWNDAPTMYSRIISNVKGYDRHVKILLSVGGWKMASKPFSDMVQTARSRERFATTTVSYLRKYKFDGFDIDWEYPTTRGGRPEDKRNYVKLLKVLRTTFNREASPGTGRLLLTAAVAAGKKNIDAAYYVPNMVKYLDFTMLMAYDFHGSWENFTGMVSPLYSRQDEEGNETELNLDWAAKYWVDKGMPKDKFVIGLATYGRSFTTDSSIVTGLAAPSTVSGKAGKYTKSDGFLAYYEICELIKQSDTTVHLHKEHRVPYLINGDQWVGYEDKSSIREKVKYMKDNGYGGVMVWSLALDDFVGEHCGVKFPLLESIVSECYKKDSKGQEIDKTKQTDYDNDDADDTDYDYDDDDGGNDGLKKGDHNDGDDDDGNTYGQNIDKTKQTDSDNDDAHDAIYDYHDDDDDHDDYDDYDDDGLKKGDHNYGDDDDGNTYGNTGSAGNPLDPATFCKGKMGSYADPTDCSYYFSCFGASFRMPCPSGLYFNEMGHYCDWPFNVASCT